MDINWFPGHMTKATRLIESNIKNVDIVFYVLDARAPKASLNPHFNKAISGLPIIYALNKADLAPRGEISAWTGILSSPTERAVAIDSTRSKSTRAMITESRFLLAEKLERKAGRGINYTIRAMVLGVPNTGKSTLINNLCGSARTQTGNRPGVTRGKQWLSADEYFEVLDTPGVLAPLLDDQRLARHLAFVGSVRDEVLDMTEIAGYLLAELNSLCPELVRGRYGAEMDSLETLARARGFVLRGGIYDIDRASVALIDDFRKGRLGRIILEKADEYVRI